jgi:cation:H+ antiporter
MLLAWGGFAASVVIILIAGPRLSRYGDIIAEKTGLGGNWVGLVMLATATSLPELATGISSVTIAAVPNVAVGNILGACVINLSLILVLDLMHSAEPLLTRAGQGHILSAGFGVILLGFVGFNILVEHSTNAPAVGHVGVTSFFIVALYLIAIRTVYRYESRERREVTETVAERYGELSLARAQQGFVLSAAVVVATGALLPFIADRIAAEMGWHRTFVGTLLVAMVTTLPEMTVSVAALRLGALDMAIGNLLGSNLFNVTILAVDDVFFTAGPLLEHVDPIHAVSAFSAVMMSGIAVVGLLYRAPTRLYRRIGWSSLFLFSLYVLNSFVLFLYGQ